MNLLAANKKRLLSVAILSSVLVLTGCDDDDDPIVEEVVMPEEPMVADIRVLHASPDAPAVNIWINGEVAIEDLDYAESSGYARLDAGSYDIDVEGIIPSGNAVVIDVDGLELGADSMSTVIAVNDVANIEPLVVPASAAMPTETEVGVTVVHAAAEAPAVDVYVVDPGADITMLDPAFNFEFKDSVDAGALAAGEVELVVAVGDTVVYNSGSVDLGPFAGTNLMIVAVPTVTQVQKTAAPIKLMVLAGDDIVALKDADTMVGAKVVHASPDATAAAGGDVEVWATSEALGADPVQLIDAFGYTDVVPAADMYVEVPMGSYTFDVGTNVDSIGGSVYTSDMLDLMKAQELTVIASGRLTADPMFSLMVTEDMNRAVATQASVKVAHAAPAAGTVDVYVTAAGEYSVADVEGMMAGDPLLDDFEYGAITDYVVVAPGDYDIRVVAGGMVAINVEGFTLGGGTVSTVIARGPSEPSGEPSDFGVIVLTN